MTVIIKLRNKLRYFFARQIKPEIIGGWKNANGSYSKNTGVSNFTHVSQKNDNLFIGDNVFIGHFNYIDGYNAKLVIKDGVQITNYCQLLTHSTHNSLRFNIHKLNNENILQDINKIGELVIGESTYIGPHTVIMPNTAIGKNCIVSAYSYVQGNFPDFSIIRGIPAKIIGDTRKIDAELLEKYPELSII
ncbi:MAG: acyltransferase [Bacteroidales bacterium]|nr:acyltransferase [Bacteroidales bacterium]